jgi:hypothetical protein
MAEILASERVFGLRPARFEERELLVRQKLLDQFDESIDLDWFLQNRINFCRLWRLGGAQHHDGNVR